MLSLFAAAAFVWTKAPLYNPRNSIDAWLYTALWTNFDQIYSAFEGTYYASRVSWIAPGYLLNEALEARVAALVLHSLYFFAGAVFLYLLCKRFFGWVPAAVAYIALVGSPMYLGAHRWDYWEGAAISLLAGSVYLATPLTANVRRRFLSLFLGGLLSAALVSTIVFASVYLIAGLPVLYAVVLMEAPRGRRARRFGLDLSAYGAGVALLMMLSALFARAHGGSILFFMPQVRTALSDVSFNKQPLEMWLGSEPRVVVPLFVVAIAGSVLAVRRLDRVPRRALIATALWTSTVFVLLSIWRFAGDGFFFEYVWYFSMFLIPVFACLAGATAGLADVTIGSAKRCALVLAVATAGVLAPLLMLYRDDDASDFADGIGYEQYLVMAAAMGFALIVTFVSRGLRRWRAPAAVVAVAMAIFGATYGLDVSKGTFIAGDSDPEGGALYDLGQSFIRHLRDEGFDETLPRFWYDGTSATGVAGALQSLYYYSYTFVGVAMPTIDDDFRSRMSLFRPERLVLLCDKRGCAGGPDALRQAGYRPQLDSRSRLAKGSLAIWVEIYTLLEPEPA